MNQPYQPPYQQPAPQTGYAPPPQQAPVQYAPPPNAAQMGVAPAYQQPPGAYNPAIPANLPPQGQQAPQGAVANVPGARPGYMKTGEVRFNYFFILRRDRDGKQRCTLLVPKSDQQTYQALLRAQEEALVETWGAKRPQYFRTCIKDGDTHRNQMGAPLGEECRGHWVVNASANKTYIRVLDEYGMEILDPNRVGSGDYGKASITLWGSDQDQNIGVNCQLNSVMFTRKGESLGGGGAIPAEQEFASDFKQPPPGYQPPMYNPPPAIGGPQHAQQGHASQAPQGQPVSGFNQAPQAPAYAPPPQQAPQYPQAPAYPQQPPAYTPPPQQAPRQPGPPTTQPPQPIWDQQANQWVNAHWDGFTWNFPGINAPIPF